MKKIIILLTVLSFCAAGLAGAEVLQTKNLGVGTLTLRACEKSTGEDLWESSTTTQIADIDGERYLYKETIGKGIYGKDRGYKTWRTEAYFKLANNSMTPYRVMLAEKSRDGNTVRSINKYYDRQENVIVCEVDGKMQRLEFKEDMVDAENLGTLLLNYPFQEKREVKFHLLTEEPSMYNITIKYLGQETITVGDSEIECHKLQMIPDLGALNIFGGFIPKTYWWYEVSPPHAFVRYEGLESGLGTPYIVVERTVAAAR